MRLVLAGVAAVVLLQFQFITLGTFPLTIAPLLLFLLLGRCLVLRPSLSGTIILLVVVFYPFGVALFEQNFDTSHFLRTYALWVTAFGALVAALTLPIKRTTLDLTTPAFFGLLVTSSFSILQYLLGKAGNYALYSIWGNHSYFGGYDPTQHGIIRASGFYLEPSFNALVMVTLLTVVFLSGTVRQRKVALVFAVGGLLVTQSVAGAVGLALAVILLRVPKGGRAGASSWIPGVVLLAGFFSFQGFVTYLSGRASSLLVLGSSANYRLVAPLTVVNDVLLNHPLGRPLGTIQSTLSGFGLLNGVSVGTSLDTGPYYLVFYTGWLGLIGLTLTLIWALPSLRSARAASGPRGLALVVLVMLFYTGGVILPEFVFLAIILILSWRGAVPSVA